MKEISILAGFSSLQSAQQAANELQQLGCSTVKIDEVSSYPGKGVDRIMNPITGEIPNLGSMTLSGDFPSGRDASVLAASDPSASGMADRGAEATMPNLLLTCLVDDAISSKANQIIQSHGGLI
ncbi:hypothetical protein C0R09_23290 [Brevibacillus laterosporus]|uniref:hypothetical protein n=1 Tax=Brevibacillus laterosporus TaxID=1465 RepID=UPI0002405135|nr:hypothetical protein [Brevibacillus laterosporus]AUM67206.1 hypothetical protein C0R09_23290 [Brevibacillus laterosporus]CCF16040.1 putative uncharacterized protein [Brevibacillus laterosporus GI-9]